MITPRETRIAKMEAQIAAGLHTPRTVELLVEYRQMTDAEYDTRLASAQSRTITRLAQEATRS